MKKIMMIFTVICISLLMFSSVYGKVGIGADVYSRYVWRGTDFGNSASVQPSMSFSAGGLEVGAWASYPITSDATSLGANENDLYVSYAIGDLGITLTDYYFPEGGEVFNYSSDDGFHFLEGSVSYGIGSVSLLAGYFFSGDSDNSTYFELGYGVYEDDDKGVSLTVGAGDGMYVIEEDFNIVNVGLTVSAGSMSASYIINPDSETNFLFVGYSF